MTGISNFYIIINYCLVIILELRNHYRAYCLKLFFIFYCFFFRNYFSFFLGIQNCFYQMGEY